MTGTKELTARIQYEEGASNKVRVVTKVTIYLGKLNVARAVLGGRYSQEQALREYRTNSARFEKFSGHAGVVALGLVA